MITRRTLLARGAAAGLAGLMPMRLLASEVSLGSSTVTTVSDGQLVLPEAFAIGENPRDVALEIIAAAGIDGPPFASPCNLTLWRDGDNTILFDAGAGPAFMEGAGRVVDSLAAIGVEPGDVTHVVFTHGHPDHLWGVLDDFDEPLFQNASHHMGAREHAYWLDPATIETIGAERQSFVAGAQRRLEMIGDAMSLIEDGQEILPGLVAVATPGHTPGHMSFRLSAGDERLLVVGDAIGNAHIALARPDWPAPADHDPDLGAATRIALLEALAASGEPMVGFHLTSGGLGTIAAAEVGYVFTPLT